MCRTEANMLTGYLQLSDRNNSFNNSAHEDVTSTEENNNNQTS
jgi:hypothetical protein